MFSTLKNAFVAALDLINPTVAQSNRRRAQRPAGCRLAVESLEHRDLMTWGSVPATISWPSSVNVGEVNPNGRQGQDRITNGEVDVYGFVAQRSGLYTFTAGQNGSQIDTIAGVFSWNGNRLAGNDDFGASNDSKIEINLVAGTRYAFAITNYSGSAVGSYKWSMKAPPLVVSHSIGSINDINTFGRATLEGKRLELLLTGNNRTSFSTHVHKVEVYLLDANNQAIHTGNWNLSFKSGGRYVPGLPVRKDLSQTFDLSSWNLSQVRTVRIVLS